jgi:hypothetical protein
MPSGSERERERFASAVEYGLGALPADRDDELLRELELVAMLRQSRAALAPSVDESARMRARIMAVAAAEMAPTANTSIGNPTLAGNVAAVANAPTREQRPVTANPIADAPTRVTAPIHAETTQVEPVSAELASMEGVGGEADTNVVPLSRAGRRGRHRFPTSKAPSRQQRGLLGLGAAAAVMVVALTGGSAMFSQGALPGDSLYGIKQVTESTVVGLTPGAGNKSQRQLDYAASRIDEAQKVNASNSPDAEKSADISQALKGFDTQTESGSQMALQNAQSNPSNQQNKAQFNELSSWSQKQSQKLSQMKASMPASAQPDADHSLRLLEDVRTRSQSLSNRQGCDKVASGESDSLGPVPAKGACSSKAATEAPTFKSVSPAAPATSPVPDTSSSSTPSTKSHSSSTSDSGRSHESGGNSNRSQNGKQIPGLSDLSDNNNDNNSDVLPDKKRVDNPLPLPDRENNSDNGGLLPGLLGGQ